MGIVERLHRRFQGGVAPRLPAIRAWSGKHRFNLIRAGILASSVALMLPGAWGHSVTVVEFAHLPAGLAAWQRGSLGIYRVCGPVPKLLYAMPAYLGGVRVDYPASFDSDTRSRREWELGQIFQSQHADRYHNIYRLSRLVPVAVTIFGGCLACGWSTRLFGVGPGLVSLCAWSWMPPILAHGSLVTSDMLSAVILLLAARTFWTFLLGPNLITAFTAGLSLGLAAATKFSLLILYPCWILVLAGRVIQPLRSARDGVREGSLPRAQFAAFGLVILVTSVVVLDAFYLFHDVWFRLARWQSGASSLAHGLYRSGEWRTTAWLLQIPLPIPLEFLRGLDSQLADTERLQSAYVLGRTRLGGWWYWHAVASLIKIPLPTLGICGLAIFRLPAAIRGGEPILWASLCLLVPAAEVALVISATTGTGTNATFRYLVPSIAVLCVWSGNAACSRTRGIRSASMILLVWLAVNAGVAAPDHLGWQNELGWAWRHSTGRPALIGDSLDWGQDLARLGTWITRHSGEGNAVVCLYGLGDTAPYGMGPPSVRPISGANEQSTYLIVSEAILLGDSIANCLSVAGVPSSLTEAQRETLLQSSPIDRVGRTAQVYRLRDFKCLIEVHPLTPTGGEISAGVVARKGR